MTGGLVPPDQTEPREANRLTSLLMPEGRRAYLSWLLIALNCLVWGTMEIWGRMSGLGSDHPQLLLDFGATSGPLVAEGQYWRLFTAIFVHIGVLHLLFNCVGLFMFGRLLETTYGRKRFLLIYCLSGLAGGVASYNVNSFSIAAGASGAIFGILGALVSVLLINRHILNKTGWQTLLAIAVLTAVNVVFGFTVPGIDKWAHVAGLAAGLALGLAFAPKYSQERGLVPSSALAGLALPALAALLVAGAWYGTASMPESPLVHVARAERLIHLEDTDGALNELHRSLELNPNLAKARYLRGKVLLEKGERRGAILELSLAVRLGLEENARQDAVALLLALDRSS